MPPVEIDEAEYKALRGAHNLLDTLMKDPKTRPFQEKLIKAKFPTVTTSEDDPRVKEMRALAGTVKGFIDTQEREKIQTRLDAKFDKLRNDRHYTDEGIEKIKKVMIERSIPDPEDAAMVFEGLNPPKQQEPSIYGSTDWGFGAGGADVTEDDKLLWNNEDAWLNKEVGRVLRDFRKGEEF